MLRVAIDDRPGTLVAVLGVVADAGGNLLDVQHQRLLADAPIRSVDVDIVVESMTPPTVVARGGHPGGRPCRRGPTARADLLKS